MLFAIFLLIMFQIILSLLQSDGNKAAILKDNNAIMTDLTMPCKLPSFSQKAYSRATTPSCKSLISKTACLNAIGVLDVGDLPQLCPLQGDLQQLGTYISCHKITPSLFQRYNNSITINPVDNSPQRCVSWCRNLGRERALLFRSTHCLCLTQDEVISILPDNTALSEAECISRCPPRAEELNSEERSRCGSDKSAAIYDTLVKPIQRGISAIVDQSKMSEMLQHKPVRIAFLLVLNGRAWRQVKRLIKNLYHVNHYFYIHVDERANYLYHKVKTLQDKYWNIRVTRWRLSTIWGGASLLEMVLRAMTDLLTFSEWHWDFVINLSESDFPIRSNKELVAYLTANRNKNFVKSHGQDTKKFLYKQGFNYLFVECDRHLWMLDYRNLPGSVPLDGGSDWFILNYRFVKYVIYSQDRLVEGLKKYFKYSLLPVESFFHTVLINSAFCDSIVDNHLHLVNWKRSIGCRCQHKHEVDWCGCSPNVLRYPSDRRRLEAAREKSLFFARKFESIVDVIIINYAEDFLHNQAALTVHPSRASYWENLYSSETDDHSESSFTGKAFFAILRMIQKKLLSSRPAASACYRELRRKTVNLLEVDVYHHMNQPIGLLFLIEWSPPPGGKERKFKTQTFTELNPLLKSKQNIRRGPADSQASKRVLEFEVGESCDAKESMFRDHTRFIGPDSVISARFLVAPGQTVTIFLYVFDPNKRLVRTLAFQILPTLESMGQCLSLSNLSSPLSPGFWTVQTYLLHLSHHNLTPFSLDDPNLVIETQFLVLPLSDNMERFVSQLWHPSAHCLHHSTDQDDSLISDCFKMDSCITKTWSSVYPDPKSDLRMVNPVNGYLTV